MLTERQFSFMGVNFPVLLSSTESIISAELEKNGTWEPYHLSLYPLLVPNGGTYIDVGANVGINSLFLYHTVPGARVFAVEASEANFKTLQRNTEGTEIRLFHQAIADIDGTIGFGGDATNAQIASLAFSVEFTVRCERLDSFAAANGIRHIDLIKIDVEGFTDLVLAGAEESLAITQNAIIEFSIGQVLDRFAKQGDMSFAEAQFTKQISLIQRFMPHTYYISRKDGLIEIERVSDLISLLSIEHAVGDVLFTREAMTSKSSATFALERVQELMQQNHLRILEVGLLTHENKKQMGYVQELREENHLRIQEIRRLAETIVESALPKSTEPRLATLIRNVLQKLK